MEYNEAFWVSVAAAAPVFALTYVVSTRGANQVDHDLVDFGIWGSWKPQVIIAVSLLGFIASAVAFVWAIVSLLRRQDVNPITVPAGLLILSFLTFLILVVLEMRAYTWAKFARRGLEALDKYSVLSVDLRQAGYTDGSGRVFWPPAVAVQVVRVVTASGFVVTGINIRDDDSGIGTRASTPVSRYGFSEPEDALKAALMDLNSITSPESFVEITWTRQ